MNDFRWWRVPRRLAENHRDTCAWAICPRWSPSRTKPSDAESLPGYESAIRHRLWRRDCKWTAERAGTNADDSIPAAAPKKNGRVEVSAAESRVRDLFVLQSPTASWKCSGHLGWGSFRKSRLNLAAGGADASRAMLLTSCRKVTLLIAISAFLLFSQAVLNQ